MQRSLGLLLRNARGERFSQEALGRLVGVARQRVGQWERNEGEPPTTVQLDAIATALDVPLIVFVEAKTHDELAHVGKSTNVIIGGLVFVERMPTAESFLALRAGGDAALKRLQADVRRDALAKAKPLTEPERALKRLPQLNAKRRA